MDTTGILNALKAERDRLGNAIAALEGRSGRNGRRGRRSGSPRQSTATAGTKPKRRLSAAARKRISEAAKARWAKAKKAGKNSL